jgi:D-aminoacyl-tRNA deacylase
MRDEVAIICSNSDPASRNIAERLLEMGTWKEDKGYFSFRQNRLVVHDQDQIRLSGLDDSLAELGLGPGLIVLASRHQSKEGLPWLGGHFTGSVERGELSEAAPAALRSFLLNLRRCAADGLRISAEATHHGPTDIRAPSFFAEIGSAKEHWADPEAGEAVARAILGIEPMDLPVFLGFGGGHYVQRQSSLMLESGIAFGHLFSNYQVRALDVDLVDQARRRSVASYAYLDRGSLRSEEKRRISEILDALKIPQMREGEIRARFPAAEL